MLCAHQSDALARQMDLMAYVPKGRSQEALRAPRLLVNEYCFYSFLAPNKKKTSTQMQSIFSLSTLLQYT